MDGRKTQSQSSGFALDASSPAIATSGNATPASKSTSRRQNSCKGCKLTSYSGTRSIIPTENADG